jgi:hypothetical protein
MDPFDDVPNCTLQVLLHAVAAIYTIGWAINTALIADWAHQTIVLVMRQKNPAIKPDCEEGK